MVDAISSSQQSFSISMQQTQSAKSFSADEMFQKLMADVEGSGDTISKEQLENCISELESSDSEDKGKLGFLYQLAENFDTISGGESSITVDNLADNMDLLAPPKGGPGGPPPSGGGDQNLSQLLSSIDTDGSGVTQSALEAYLEGLSSDNPDVALISELISDFDSVSTNSETISLRDLQSYMESQMATDWQDPSTITSKQLESPIDIRV